MGIHSILLVEDNPNDVELTLEGLAEYNLANDIHIVHDGAEALDYLYRRGEYASREEGNPAVVLLDLKLPRVSGIEVLKTIKADSNLHSIPIVVLTSSNQERDLVAAYDGGANAYVVKPVDFKKFVEAIRQVGVFWALLNERPLGSIKRHREI